ncbi:MAG: HEPN domain-containing protein [Sphingobacteriales bacterium]|nr:MAG: HEPN domain-containing protein [Sphingobacteriales bacterium]
MSTPLQIIDERLLERIVTVSHPKAIFSSGNLWIILLADNSMYTIEDVARLLNPLFHAHKVTKFIVVSYGQLVADIRKVNLFVCASCLSENLIYDPEGLIISTPEIGKRAQALEQATSQFHYGLGRSGAFADGATFYFAKKELPIAMFMLHQAIELLLRGILISLTNYNLRSHSLNEFNNKIRKCAPKLVFLEDGALEEKYLLEQLEYSYSSARYNLAYEVGEERVLLVFEKIRSYTNLATQIFNSMVSTFKNAYPLITSYEK